MTVWCRPRWTDQRLSELYRSYVELLGGETAVYVESLDGVCDPAHVKRLLLQWGLALEDTGLPIVASPLDLLLLVDDDAYFPGYDTIWLIRPRQQGLQQPSFMTWYAAEKVGATPKDMLTYEALESWDPVAQWMSSANAIVGLSQGFFTLDIRSDIR